MNAMQGTLDGFDAESTPPALVAKVLVDTDLPHLDRPLNYLIPEALEHTADVGHLVRVRLAGTRRNGWIMSRGMESVGGRLEAVESVVSACPVVTPELIRLARRIADRHLATMSQVFSLALPTRHAATEKAVLASRADASQELPSAVEAPDPKSWSGYPAGSALLEHLAAGGAPRAVWTALAPSRLVQLGALIRACAASGRSTVVVVPTAFQAEELRRGLEETTGLPIVLTGSDVSPAQRYRIHLDAIDGRIPVVIGTRSAVWTPVRDLGLIIVWDDGDDHLLEQRAPRCDAIDVAVTRAHLEGAGLVCGAYSRSVKAQALVRSGWAVSLVADPQTKRDNAPKIHLHGVEEAQRDGASGSMRLPSGALRMICAGLQTGPVLVQVATSGYVPVISCQRCRTIARCPNCGGQLSLGAGGRISCTWCSREATGWRCPACSSTRLRAVRVGSQRTAEELARNVPDASILESSVGHRITRRIAHRGQVVVATAGAEPTADGGYEAVLVLDAQAVAGRAELWAPEEAMRRWFNAFSLLAPGRHGMLVGAVSAQMGQAVVRWDPVDFADRLLDEREALRFFPATTIIALDGPGSEVLSIVDQVGAEILGTVERGTDHGTEEVRTLIRVERIDADEVLGKLMAIQRKRASRKLPVVRTTVNPPELF